MGQGEGSQIISLFGRSVRLEGREYLLERMERHIASSRLEKTRLREHPSCIPGHPLVGNGFYQSSAILADESE